MCLCSYLFQGYLKQINKKEIYLINKCYTKKPGQNIENKFPHPQIVRNVECLQVGPKLYNYLYVIPPYPPQTFSSS